MKRRLFKLVVFVFLGAIVNVAVAWGFAWPASDQLGSRSISVRIFLDHVATEVEVDHLVNLGWPRRTDTAFFIHKVIKSQETDPGFAQQYYYETSERSPRHSEGIHAQIIEAFAVHVQSGWPLLCLEGDVWLPTSSYNSGWTQDPSGMVNIGDNHLLPTRIVQPGFFINTIFYAAILWALTFGALTARRMIRRKRGHCIKCGYDLRETSEGCPECGWGRKTKA